MTKKKLSFKKWLSMLLTAVMLVAALPISAFAAPASGIPANMLDNVYLDALAYTGYNVQAQKDDLYKDRQLGVRLNSFGYRLRHRPVRL